MGRTRDKTWVEDVSLLEPLSKQVETDHSTRTTENHAYLRAYWDRPVMPPRTRWDSPAAALAVYESLREMQGSNLTAEVVDAAVALVCRSMSAEVVPVGADFDLEQGCLEATRMIEGVFDNSGFERIMSLCARDGMTADEGPFKGYIDPASGEIRFMRVNPLEHFWVNDRTTRPRTEMTISPVSRDELEAQFPSKKAEIRGLSTWEPQTVVGVDPPSVRNGGNVNTVRVVESWCRQVGSSVGRHAIVSGDLVFVDEPWTHEITPIGHFIWSPDFRGYAGRSLARIISKFDNANRRLTRMAYEGFKGAVPIIMKHADSEFQGISDMPYQLAEWEGLVEPKVVIPQAVSPQILDQIKEVRMLAFAEGGVNQGMAQGQLQKQYSSGKAQSQAVDIANTRLLDAQEWLQDAWKQAAKIVVMLCSQAKKTHVRLRNEKRYQAVKWPNLKTDQYQISFGLTSGLSLTPSGRLDELDRLREAGAIDMPAFLRNLDLPDTQTEADRANAPIDLVQMQIHLALSKAEFTMPSSMQGAAMLNEIVSSGGQQYQQAVLRGNVPLKNMEALRKLISAAKSRLAPPVSPAPAVQAPVPVTVTPPQPTALTAVA